MSRVTQIVAQRGAGLLSLAEARTALDAHRRQSAFNSTYAEDNPDALRRWYREEHAARRALVILT